MGTRTIYPCRL